MTDDDPKASDTGEKNAALSNLLLNVAGMLESLAQETKSLQISIGDSLDSRPNSSPLARDLQNIDRITQIQHDLSEILDEVSAQIRHSTLDLARLHQRCQMEETALHVLQGRKRMRPTSKQIGEVTFF